jgi:uncharacterized protein (DUF1697 family)
MPTYVGLLRAVNVSGTGALDMAGLRRSLEDCGLEGVRSWIQSGNVVFRSPRSDSASIEATIEAQLAQDHDLATDVFVRSAADWRAAIDRNPYAGEARDDPARLTLLTLKDAPSPDAWAGLRSAIVGREKVLGGRRHGYIYYPDGQGRSKFTLKLIESRLGTRGTVRNWNTVRKLAELAGT